MVGDERRASPGRYARRSPPRGVRDDERADAEPAEHAHAEDGPVGADALVEVRAPAHHGDRHAVDRPEHEHARVADRGRDGPAGDLAVRDLDARPRARPRSRRARCRGRRRRAARAAVRARIAATASSSSLTPSPRRRARRSATRRARPPRAGRRSRISSSTSSGEISPSSSISSRTQSSSSSQ